MIVSCWRLRWRHNTGRNINNRFCISISANCRWGCSMVTKSMSGSNSCYSCTPRWFLRAFSSARWIWWDTQPIWRSQTSWRWWTDLKRKRNILKLFKYERKSNKIKSNKRNKCPSLKIKKEDAMNQLRVKRNRKIDNNNKIN